MNQMEQAALQHATEWLRYQGTQKASDDLAADVAKRRKRDRDLGHSPRCGLLKCHPECPSQKA